MRLQIVLFALAITACSDELAKRDHSGHTSEGAELPGVLRVSISRGGIVENFAIERGRLSATSDAPNAPKHAVAAQIAGERGATFLSGNVKMHLVGPYAMSVNQSLVAASYVQEGNQRSGAPFLPTAIGIWENTTRKLLASAEGDSGWYIDSIGWSPDSNYVAVVKKKETRAMSLLGLFGHPATENEFHLVVYDTAGRQMMHIPVSSSGAVGWSKTEWTP